MSNDGISRSDGVLDPRIYRAADRGADWLPADRRVARREGWDLAMAGRGPCIQRTDDTAPFADDAEALRHVKYGAARGSDVHQRALAIHVVSCPWDKPTTAEMMRPLGDDFRSAGRMGLPWLWRILRLLRDLSNPR
jgi:hypothetical protein